ncbi:hypothetical protein [Stenotrophomonas sp. PS02297]|uniref:hypothetical protein n=1 Tax=unclassified Stenotrophomonas TaxID=196198 RepID=UPI00249A6519|nr:hypothetical protein [Stenotrophomonas sp. PS02297]
MDTTRTDKTKNKSKPPRTARFDFSDASSSDGAQTGTLKQLLEELTYERNTTPQGKSIDKDGKQMSVRQLTPVLRLLRSISGKPLTSITELHPLSDIKTIKTLHTYSYDSGTHLVSLLEPPGIDSQAVMNILTSPPNEESRKVLDAKKNIINDLELEISEEDKKQVDLLFSSPITPHAHYQQTNESIDKVLLTHFHLDNDRAILLQADDYLVAKTQEFWRSSNLPVKEQSLHLAAYVYLRSLEFFHSLNFEITTNRLIPNDKRIDNVLVDFSQICRSLPAVDGIVIKGDTPFMSIEEVSSFCNDHASDLAGLVAAATGYSYGKRDILGKDLRRATCALALYLASIKLPSDQNPKPIGVVHVVAAFCSVLHQRKLKSKQKKSRRYGSKLSSPQKQLDAYLAGKEKYVAPPAQFVYCERTLWYCHALVGRAHVSASHMRVQAEQSKLLLEIYGSLDPRTIHELTAQYREHMVGAAQSLVTEHGREHIQYEWIHGLRSER